jgi:hypothetical protein
VDFSNIVDFWLLQARKFIRLLFAVADVQKQFATLTAMLAPHLSCLLGSQ